MKRKIMTAVIMGFSGVAVAQSSVSLYGVADAGIGKAKVDGDTGTKMLSGSTMSNLTSRVGVRGSEDLGGGLNAGFTFETGLSLNDGATYSGGNGGGFWGRTAELWLAGDWGRFSMGRSYSPADSAVYAWELTGTANYSLYEGMFLDVGTDFRNNSQFSYSTPSFLGGLSAQVAYIFKDDRADGNSKWDLNLIYDNSPVVVAVDVNKVKSRKANYGIGVRYTINGTFKVAASYTDARSMNLGAPPLAERRGFTIGGSAQFGLASVTLDVGRDTKVWLGQKKYTNGLIEGKYNLSKRTMVYAAYLRLNGDNNWGIGLQHRF